MDEVVEVLTSDGGWYETEEDVPLRLASSGRRGGEGARRGRRPRHGVAEDASRRGGGAGWPASMPGRRPGAAEGEDGSAGGLPKLLRLVRSLESKLEARLASLAETLVRRLDGAPRVAERSRD